MARRPLLALVLLALLLAAPLCLAADEDEDTAPAVKPGRGKGKGKGGVLASRKKKAAKKAVVEEEAQDEVTDDATAKDEVTDDGTAKESSSDAEKADDAASEGAEKADDTAAEGAEKGDDTVAEAAEKGDDSEADSSSDVPKGKGSSLGVLPKSTSGQTDIDPKGNCSDDLAKHCKGLQPGKLNLANCITFHVKNEKSGNDANAIPISDGCKTEVRSFRIEMYRDLSMDQDMAEKCKEDIHKNCDDDFLYPEPGNIVACLREVNQVDKLSDSCKSQVLRAQLDASEDFKKDPQLNELCSVEADRLCKGVKPGEGRVQECLRSHREKLAWDCQAELFRQEVENADDIRLNVRLFQACLNDQRKFCADVRYGDARVKDCLEGHRLDPDFSPRCKTEFDKMMERRASDFRLDSTLRKVCKSDITEICYPDAEDISDVANWDAKVIQCLQDYREELKDSRCRDQVHKLTKRAAEDVRFDKPLADACYTDRQSLCKDVPDGMAQVFLCLQEHQADLKEACKTAMFEELVRFAEDIDFKFPMKQACSKELDKFCKDVPEGHAAKIQCLQQKVDDTDMGEDCRKEINRDLTRSAEDYRLNYRLNKACFSDISKICSHACDKELEAGSATCKGTVLKCLQENSDKIESDYCKQEVFNFNRLVVRDPLTFDYPLQKACAANITTLCKDVSKDHSATLGCLRKHRRQLSKECRNEEKRFSIMEASDIRLTPTVMNACGQELQGFCKDVPPSGGEAFKCLQTHLEDPRMGAACKGEVNLQELRHASNYRLDVRVYTECQGDVDKFCKDVDEGEEGHALVLKCMVEHDKELSGPCETEVAYAARAALWQYSRNASLTQPCDETVQKLCKKGRRAKAVNGVVVGVFGQCLVALPEAVKAKMPEECRALVTLAAKEGAHAGGSVDQTKLEETLKKIAELQAATAAAVAAETDGASAVPSETGLVITGWMAALAIAALVLVLVGVAYGVYQRFYSPSRNYTLVVKGAEPPPI